MLWYLPHSSFALAAGGRLVILLFVLFVAPPPPPSPPPWVVDDDDEPAVTITTFPPRSSYGFGNLVSRGLKREHLTGVAKNLFFTRRVSRSHGAAISSLLTVLTILTTLLIVTELCPLSSVWFASALRFFIHSLDPSFLLVTAHRDLNPSFLLVTAI